MLGAPETHAMHRTTAFAETVITCQLRNSTVTTPLHTGSVGCKATWVNTRRGQLGRPGQHALKHSKQVYGFKRHISNALGAIHDTLH